MELVADEGFTDVIGAGFDAGIRYGEALAKDMIAIPLGGPQKFCVVGSPSYFREHGRPYHPRDLVDHRCFGQLFPRGNHLRWSFEQNDEEIDVSPSGPIFSTEPYAQIEAARAGLGLALLFVEHCGTDIESGRLETVLDDWCQPFAGPFLYYPERRLMPAALRAFVNFVKASKDNQTSGNAEETSSL